MEVTPFAVHLQFFRKVLSVDSAGYCAEGLTYTHESIHPTKVREMVLYHF